MHDQEVVLYRFFENKEGMNFAPVFTALPVLCKFLETMTRLNDFRNTYIAHQEQELIDKNLAEQELKIWIEALRIIGK